MQGKYIKRRITDKIADWAASIDSVEVKNAILKDTLVTGGAIVSLLQNEEPHDYDIYFRNEESLRIVVQYYIDKFVDLAKSDLKPILQRCVWDENGNRWRILGIEDSPKNGEEVRLRVFIRSQGAVGEDYDGAHTSDIEYKREIAKLGDRVKKNIEKASKERYRPVFLTNNAITLSDKIQIVLRFFGEPSDIHDNYDFVHCTSYWTSWDDKLVMPVRALEAIINKELYYIGSRYPLCSIIRTRKFMDRGWTINAGQYVKMCLQLNEMDLTNLHIFEEQLIGVDSAYFNSVIWAVQKEIESSEDCKVDSQYLIKLINDVFD